MDKYDIALIYLSGFKIVEEVWDRKIDNSDALGDVLGEMDPYKWDNCLSGDPAYEEEFIHYLNKNFKGKNRFSLNEVIKIIKGYFLSYKPIAKNKTYVLQQLENKEDVKKRLEDMKNEEIYKIHFKNLKETID